VVAGVAVIETFYPKDIVSPVPGDETAGRRQYLLFFRGRCE
jgi:hypothetical protein